MASSIFLALSLHGFLIGGGIHGVVVDKHFKPLPLAHSLGVDGIYDLELRDDKNHLHRQMVTRGIFLRYDIGDVFDDRASKPKLAEQTATPAPAPTFRSTIPMTNNKASSQLPAATPAAATEPIKSSAEDSKLMSRKNVKPQQSIAPEQAGAKPKIVSNESRVAQAFEKRDMLPDSEGF